MNGRRILGLWMALMLAACGGGGGSAPATGGNPPPTVNVPATPTGITVTPAETALDASWNAVSGATGYRVYYSATAGVDTSDTVIVTSQTAVSISGLSNDTDYYLRVAASNSAGESALSTEQATRTLSTPVTPPTGWSQQTLINDPYDFFDRDNYLGGAAINDDGVAAASWIFAGSGNGNNFVLVNRYENGAWGSEELLENGDNSGPQVAVMPNGVIVAAWVSYELDANDFRMGATIHSRRYENGAWTPVEEITTVTPGSGVNAGAPALAADGQNNVLATWWQDQNELWVNRFDGTNWGTPERLATSIRTLSPPAIGASATDTGIVVWLDATEPNDSGQSGGGPSRPTAWASRFDGSAWSAAERIGHNDLVDFDGAERIRIDVNALGSAVVAWQQTRNNDTGTGFRIDGLRYDASADLWSAPVTITARDWQVPWPDVAIDANGAAIASWQPTDLADNSSQRILEAAFFDPGSASWGAAQAVNIDDGSTEPDPLFVEMREQGDVFAVWQQTGGVYWRRYDAASSSWQAISAIGTRNGQSMAMAMSRNGHTIVVVNPLSTARTTFEYTVYANIFTP